MKRLIDKGKLAVRSTKNKVLSEFENGVGLVKEVINDIPILISLERVDNSNLKFDEKHYFVIPLYTNDIGFSLHTMRSLPRGAPEINDLPKRRVFHFPNEYYEGSLQKHMLSSARNLANDKSLDEKNTLEKLADDIDNIDNKLTYGMLVIGGIAAIFNPLVGAGIAAKALMPSVTGLLIKYGLRPAGQRLSRAQVEKEAKQAERHVLKQFSDANTLKVINPILQELEYALRTAEDQHDPLVDPNMSKCDIPALNNDVWRELTEKALFHVYGDIIRDSALSKKARLGPEDIRWLKVIFDGLDDGR